MRVKTILSLFVIITLASCNNTRQSKNMVKVVVSYQFINISEGFDHLTKTLVFIDGEQVAQTEEHKESEKQSISFLLPKGKHRIEIINYAKYEGKWEIHSKENSYSQDCFFKEELDFQKKTRIKLLFDLDEGVSSEVK
jgi:hypothetical protein